MTTQSHKLVLASCCVAAAVFAGTSTQAIVNGPVATDVRQQGVPQVRVGGTSCSATVYSRYWILTAAHCFPDDVDFDHDGIITSTELAFTVRFLVVDAAGPLAELPGRSAVKHPKATWGQTTPGIDAALIFLDPNSTGVDMGSLYPVNYANGKLKVYQGSTASLQDRQVLAFGWGFYGVQLDRDGKPVGNLADDNLHKAWKTVSATAGPWEVGLYQGSRFNDAGTSCEGDSGGPDYLWDGSGFQMVGIHSKGTSDFCDSFIDGNVGAETWRAWAATTTATCPARTVVGPNTCAEWVIDGDTWKDYDLYGRPFGNTLSIRQTDANFRATYVAGGRKGIIYDGIFVGFNKIKLNVGILGEVKSSKRIVLSTGEWRRQ